MSKPACHDCGEEKPLREYEKDNLAGTAVLHIEICNECYEERTAAPETPAEETTYRILSTRLEELTARFEKIAKRARKIGCVPPTFETLRIEEEAETELSPVTREWEPTGVINRFHIVRLIGERPIIAGYKFLGTLEHNSEIGLIVRTVPGETMPVEYREADPTNCDHCKKKIKTRTETFVVEHIESKIAKQVGRQCVADFLGGTDPKAVLALIEYLGQAAGLLEAAADEDREFGGGDRTARLFDVLHVLALTSALCRNFGWVPRSKADEWMKVSTADRMASYLFAKDKKEFFADRQGNVDYVEMEKYQPNDADREAAEKALDWARELSSNGEVLNDYLYNLTTIAKAEAVQGNHFGLTCSIVPAYNREQERLLGIERQRKQFAESHHFGEVKKREVFILTLTRYSTFEGNFGVTHIHGFQDRAGNFAVWFGSHEAEMNLGGTYLVKATVKEHGEYKGILQTVLTRVDVLEDFTDKPEDQWIVPAAEPKIARKPAASREPLNDDQRSTARALAARKAVETRRLRKEAALAAA